MNGQGGDIEIASTQYPVESWEGNWQCEALEVSTTGSGGWRDYIAGLKVVEVTVNSFYDAAQDPINTFLIAPGADINTTLNLGGSGSTLAGFFLVDSVTIGASAAGVVPFKFTAKSNGPLVFTP